jgi:predicted O-linked N-acetylglucosamine transferase (SPINDLY family)
MDTHGPTRDRADRDGAADSPDACAAAACDLGRARLREGKPAEALSAFERALRAAPHADSIHVEMGFLHIRLGRYFDAVNSFTAALLHAPRNTDALRGRAQCLFILGRLEEAAAAYDALLAVAPDLDYMVGERLHVKLHLCDWQDYERARADIAARVRRGDRADVPGCFMCHSDSPAEQLICARTFTRSLAVPRAVARPADRPAGERIRVAYLSADFCTHATTHLAAGLFERHDRSRFETYAFSFGPSDGSAMRRRVEAAFEHFVDVNGWRDEDIAARVAQLGIDIAVDVKGHTLGGRPRIFALRPAPVQVSFLAYPGTMGADFTDYIVADRVVIPEADEAHYDEAVIYLPGSYQVNDIRTTGRMPSRLEAGLPESGFVFCCFNSVYKLTPAVFAAWMSILAAVPGSVLWLLGSVPAAERNLRAAAARCAIDARRLIFAPRVPPPEHCARIALADLFLDTTPVNSHTTASDALWAGVPLVTVAGKTFTARVATSLLHAVGLPQLSVADLAAYERLSVRLATADDELQAIRRHLALARKSSSLFDPSLYARRLEAAYREIWQRSRRGEKPRRVTIGATGEVQN